MNWKEFLKPTKAKLLLAFILAISPIISSMFCWVFANITCIPEYPCDYSLPEYCPLTNTLSVPSFPILGFMTKITQGIVSQIDTPMGNSIPWVALFVMFAILFVYSYFLMCVAAAIIGWLKKKVNQKEK